MNMQTIKPDLSTGIPELTPEQVNEFSSQLVLIDVRRPDEFVGELGHAKGAKLVTLGPDLEAWLESADRNASIVFLCRSGARSGNATRAALDMNFKNVANMRGGMIRWNESGLPVERD